LRRLGAIWLAGLLASCSWPSGRDEPWYQLRPATYWIARLGECEIPNEWGSLGTVSCRKPTLAIVRMGPAAVPACIRALKGGRQNMRAGAVKALAIYGPRARTAIPALVETLQDFGQPAQVPPGYPGSLGFTDRVVSVLAKIDPEVKESLPRLMVALRQPESVQPLSALPSARDEAWARSLAWRVGRVHLAFAAAQLEPGNEAALDVLLDSLQYEDPELRNLSAEQLKELRRGAPVRDRWGNQIGIKAAAVREWAATALRNLVPTLVPLLQHTDPAVAKRTAGAFHAMGSLAVPPLIELIRSRNRSHGDPEVRRGAILALGAVGAPASTALPDLRLLREDPDELVRANADAVLKKLDPNFAAGQAPN